LSPQEIEELFAPAIRDFKAARQQYLLPQY